ncbi:MAG: S41 family peptidase [Candidatus Moraniibacteriota bacterium]|nr:MAG: S41 family peptidase [Candidatus Moranbacteria bacterium]
MFPANNMDEATPVVENKNIGRQLQRKKQSFASIFFVAFLIALAYVIGVERGQMEGSSNEASTFSLPTSSIFSPAKNSDHPDMSVFWKTWDILHERFVDREHLDTTALLYGAIKGMLAATDDPYTTFFDPEENKSFQEDIAGSFEGIGAEIGMKNKILTVVAPLDDSPAQKAGIRSGDMIVKIDDESTSEMNIDEAVKKMRGPKGTDVKLTIFRDGEKETRDITIHRGTISVKSVKLDWKGGDIAIVKINQFGEETVDEFAAAVKDIRSRPTRGIVIDLRDDPGGLLDAAVDIGSLMIPKGKPVVLEEDSKKNRETLSTRGGDVLSGIPTVVLINEGSASAAEILSAALRENRDNVTLIGKKSFGKGSVQELVSISKSTSLKVTVARWLTPNGEQINKAGIKPDIEVDRTSDDFESGRDPQMDKALEVVGEKAK